MELAFKIVFFIAVIAFCFVVVGLFLVFLKIMFLFSPQLTFMGINFTPVGQMIQ
jgi:hypothetical protein